MGNTYWGPIIFGVILVIIGIVAFIKNRRGPDE